MPSELSGYLRSLDPSRFDVAGTTVTCWFGSKGQSRRHAVRLTEAEGEIRFDATVATAKTVKAMAVNEDPDIWAWRRNRASHIVGFRVDGQQRLLAEAVAPFIGVTQVEFEVYLTTVATEADRMELVLTARDVQ